MERMLIHIILGSIFGLTKGNSLLPAGPLNAAVGGNVLFKTKLDPTPLQSIIWGFGTVGTIITSTSTEDTITPGYEGRLTVNTSTGSLELRNVSTDDSGIYTVTIIPQTGRVLTRTTTLNVQVPVSNVKITTSSTDLMEFSSVRLSCSSSGSSLSFRWFNDSSEVTADRVQITDGGSTMTIVSVTRYDQGPFKCFVSNLVSDGTSDPVTFTISYGPENVTLKVSPSQKHHPEGSDVTLSCSAVSEPTAEFTWFCNGVLQSGTGPEFRLMNIQMNHSGSYSCQAFNSKTMRNEISQPLFISVLKNISDVSVTSSTALPVEGQSLNLTCDASGSVFTKEWMKDGSNLNSTDNIMFYDDITVLSFKNLNRKDSGRYTCRVISPISSDSFTYVINVNYGPENIKIDGPNKVSVGTPLTLSCSSESTPTATYTWKHNGTVIHHSSEYTKDSAEFTDSGEYICEATNSVTEKTDSNMHRLEVTEPEGLSGGAIAGITCACLIVAVAGAAAGYYFYRKKNENPRPNNINLKEKEEHVYENTSAIYENT
ncbi:carcinoembryonic antigen-related cell adhesion molecule 1-like [Sphaeramia orbicularis]|uniref:carcinoembryonic antigen-related cell adhesion molecule 1-like n=1 Tax=Sphaeramia orbicularis TaxID=375764 RepID=UPI00117CE7B8|nr:carcinoembryonic antigen-related cell adhesion molecule 1-like [Sphaeramia orbicularis]